MEKLLSLVVPAFNEEEAMEQSFERTYRAMSSIGYPFEIIYIDDGSRDRTWEIISRLAREDKRLRHCDSQGISAISLRLPPAWTRRRATR